LGPFGSVAHDLLDKKIALVGIITIRSRCGVQLAILHTL
jgi:hypothetical protein